MSKLLNVIKWGATLGKEPQSFLGANWIPAFLERVPAGKKRKWALRLLSLSPHYFFDGDNPAYRGMGRDEYLETVFRVNADSRVEIYEKLLKERLAAGETVLDYGCGPGFLARATAPHVAEIYAIDISAGALACARVLNGAPNIEYLKADEEGLARIPDGSIDAVYSFAVVQHLTNEVFETVLENCRAKLRPAGRLILHLQLTDEVWQTEEHWKRDRSVKGQIKYKYGLHCFGRTEEEYAEIVGRRGFAEVRLEKVEEIFGREAGDARSQRVLTARRRA
jgi:SAM-dependent methyltransferase